MKTNHFTGYKLVDDQIEDPRSVKFTNQLYAGDITWVVKNPSYLLLPAAKSEIAGTAPEHLEKVNIEHFLLYEVIKGDTWKNQTLYLEDQFDRKRNILEEVYGLIPKFFGVPCQKNLEELQNNDDHLAIYLILEEKPQMKFSIRDQRAAETGLEVQTNRYLAVPSKKREWSWFLPP
jgi:hypothetical protein